MASTAIPMKPLGGKALNHSEDPETEREYDRLRDLAREEARKRNECFDKAHEAYGRGDGAGAKQLSEQGKAHAAKMNAYNQEASEFIFRANNSTGQVREDEIDLHGQFVEEAETILEKRIRAAQSRGETHLHVIVGRGNHSINHVQKVRPRVEQVCQQLGVKCTPEENEGRLYLELGGGGGGSDAPSAPPAHHDRPDHGGRPHHDGRPHDGARPPKEDDGLAGLLASCLPRPLAQCCVVM